MSATIGTQLEAILGPTPRETNVTVWKSTLAESLRLHERHEGSQKTSNNIRPLGSVVERVTSNDKVVSSILAVGNQPYFCSPAISGAVSLLSVSYSCEFLFLLEAGRVSWPGCEVQLRLPQEPDVLPPVAEFSTAHRVYCPNTCALSAISAMSKRAKALVGPSQSRMRASGRGLVELGHGRVRSCRPWDRATPVVT